MSLPVISSVSFDKPVYAPGDIITATVAYSDPASTRYTLAVTVTDTVTGEVSTVSAPFTVAIPRAAVTVTGGQPGQMWTEVSADRASSAVFTALALAPPPPPVNTIAVTNPGAQSGTVGTAFSLQLAAAGSAPGQALTFSVAGLPAGLSATPGGLISGTPSATGTTTVTATATDTAGAQGAVSFSFAVAAVAAIVPFPAALAAGHSLLHDYNSTDLYAWRYLPGTRTPVTNGSGPCANPGSPRNVTDSGGILTLSTTNASDCGVIQSPGKYSTAAGVIEARVKFSGFTVNGAKVFADWASWWLYGDNWPAGGEIDSVETQYGNSYVSYHYGSGSSSQATTDPWTYPAKTVQLQPENTSSGPVLPNIVPDAWTIVTLAFGKDASSHYKCDVYYNGTRYTTISGSYVTGAPMFLTAGTAFGGGILGSGQTPYDVPGTVQLSYVRVFN